ncbi:MAG: FAD-dependent oxidoreductase [Oscillospiraceae bacterium]|nr:FAD-dependent oxidoreductase [Oscillospiraceae bacterium]
MREKVASSYVIEPERRIPVICEADVCVVGGSATGVFAAVRAARLGAKVVIIECQNSFGGVATNGLVSVWHSFYDLSGKKQIIAGLSEEVLSRLPETDRSQGPDLSNFFNPNELKIELDALLKEAGVRIYLHTLYAGIACEGGRITTVFVENKDGRGAIKAGFFIDATGDGDLCRDLGIESYLNPNVQPPSAVFMMQGTRDEARKREYGLRPNDDIVPAMIRRYGKEFGLEPDWGWDNFIPGLNNIHFRADTHVFGLNCAHADELTEAEIIGREKMRKVIRMMRKYGNPDEVYALVNVCSYIGIRDSYHFRTKQRADHMDMLMGKRYGDVILNGTYDIDVHQADTGIQFMRLNGECITEGADGSRTVTNWRRDMGLSCDGEMPTYYSLPFGVLVQEKYENLIAAGRMINATQEAFGALRVMVNLNQIGEAAGVAAYIAVNESKAVQNIDGVKVAQLLSKGGSANIC